MAKVIDEPHITAFTLLLPKPFAQYLWLTANSFFFSLAEAKKRFGMLAFSLFSCED